MTRSAILLSRGLTVVAVFLVLTLGGCGGGSSSNNVTTVSASISASPSGIEKGQSATLTWQTSNATSVSISGIGSVAASGSQQVTPSKNTIYTLTAQGSSGSKKVSITVPVTTTPIQHVVIIFQENRSPDNLFQDPVLIARTADIHNYGMNSKGQQIQLQPVHLNAAWDLGHSHNSFVEMYDNGKMDGADKIGLFCDPGGYKCVQPPPNFQFSYIYPSDIAPYFQLAETYTFGDRMFQTNQGPSQPAHQFILSGTSAPTPPNQPFSNYFDAENAKGAPNASNETGCTAPAAVWAPLIDPAGNLNRDYNNGYPCYDHPTMTDLLNTAGLGWKYYAPLAGSIWTAPNAIKHMCVPNAATGGTCTGPDWTNNVVLNQAQVLTDIQAGNLGAVTWVIPDGQESDHADVNDGSGPAWVASVVNAIGNSQFWSNTAIFITWDDWGGWFDHVPPPSIGFSDGSGSKYVYGFRVPLIVVSPYALPNSVVHNVYDFGSILRYIEQDFQLPNIAPGYADSSTITDDMNKCFNYKQTPLKFSSIKASKTAAYFINDKRPRTPPDID